MPLKRLISSFFKLEGNKNKREALKSRLDYAMSQSLVRDARAITDLPKAQSKSLDK